MKENRTLLQGWRPYGTRAQNCTRKSLLGNGIRRCYKFFSFARTASLILTNMCVYIYTYDCVEIVYELPLLPNNTATETSLHKPGAVRSVD
jgi:hypothetical protein